MDAILSALDVVVKLGASVMMPIIITIFALILRVNFGKALRAGLTVGVGFVGLNLVPAIMSRANK